MIRQAPQHRLNIYLDDPELGTEVKIAAARRGLTVSAFCVRAIRRELAVMGYRELEGYETPEAAALAMDRLREQIGPIGVSVRELIEEGRYR